MIFDTDNWQEIFSTIRKNLFRTILTGLAVFWGMFMLVLMLGFGKGLSKGIASDFGGTATNSFYMWAQRTTKPYKGMKPGRQFNFNNEDAKALQEQVPELDVIAPMNQLGGYKGTNNVVYGLKSGGFGINGVYTAIAKIRSIKTSSGRFINEFDTKEKRKVAVIGTHVYNVLFQKGENPIGKYIRVNGVYFKVIGVTIASGKGHEANEIAETIYLPFTTFQRAFNYGDVVGWFAITSRDDVPAAEAEEKAMAFLKERHKIAPDDPIAIGHWNMGVEFEKIQGLFSGIEGLIWFVGIGTLLAGVIGVSNIMLIVVKERTKEIGVKRALGATPFSIMSQLVMEALFLTAFAGYFGLLTGVGILELIASVMEGSDSDMFQSPEINFSVAIKALTVLIFLGAFAGLIPAKRAVSISPVEALRSE